MFIKDCGSQDLPIETSAPWDHTYSNIETLVEVEEVDSTLNMGNIAHPRCIVIFYIFSHSYTGWSSIE